MKSDKKLRSCLRCDTKFMTTPEVRICLHCKYGRQCQHRVPYKPGPDFSKYPPYPKSVNGIQEHRMYQPTNDTREE